MLIQKLVAVCILLIVSTSNQHGAVLANAEITEIDNNNGDTNADKYSQEITYDGDYETESNRDEEGNVGDTAYNGDNEEDLTNSEPFDPEKNGLLLHEYYNKVYEKYPDYDTGMMKQNLIYLGDVLSSTEVAAVQEIDTVSDQFELEPDEREMIMKKAEPPPKEEDEDAALAENAENEGKIPDDYSPVAEPDAADETTADNRFKTDDSYDELWK